MRRLFPICLALALALSLVPTADANRHRPSPRPTATRSASASPTSTPARTPSPPPSPSGPLGAFVTRTGTTLSLGGAPYRFDGLNVYAAAQAPCWFPEPLGPSLDAIGSGQEVVRVFAFQTTATTNGVRNWRYLDAMLATFAAHHVKAILVLTDQWRGQPCTDSATDRTLTWYQSGYATIIEGASSYRDWVGEIVARYRADPTIAAWQLVNEGEARNADGTCSEVAARTALRAFADDVEGLIARLDPNHLRSLGTISGECGSDEADYGYVNAGAANDLCDYHDYGYPTSPLGNTDAWNGLAVSLARCHAAGKAFFVGEIGIHWPTSATPTRAVRAGRFDAKLGAQFEAGSVGELLWCWSAIDEPGADYEIPPGDPALALLTAY